jgi:hypothetical protein
MSATSSSPTRRSVLAAAAAVGLLPATVRAAPEASAIRPFRVNIPEEQLVDLRRAHRRHAMARPRDGQRPVAGRTARNVPGARWLLGHRLRLAKGRGQA